MDTYRKVWVQLHNSRSRHSEVWSTSCTVGTGAISSGIKQKPEEIAPVPTVQEGEWTPEPPWKLWIREILIARTGNRTRISQPVARRYTATATALLNPEERW
jgi:hypothetical protein